MAREGSVHSSHTLFMQRSIFTKSNKFYNNVCSRHEIEQFLLLAQHPPALKYLVLFHQVPALFLRREAPSNETTALTKTTDMGVWIIGTTNQVFIRRS